MNKLNELLESRDSLVKKLGEMEYRLKIMNDSPSIIRNAMKEIIIKKQLEISEKLKEINDFLTNLLK